MLLDRSNRLQNHRLIAIAHRLNLCPGEVGKKSFGGNISMHHAIASLQMPKYVRAILELRILILINEFIYSQTRADFSDLYL